MESLALQHILQVVNAFGVPGIVFILWYFSTKSNEKTLLTYREDMMATQARHAKEISDIRQMYENNVKLVQDYCSLASDLRSIVVMNTQAWQRAEDSIRGNQFCPNVRLIKSATGKVTE